MKLGKLAIRTAKDIVPTGSLMKLRVSQVKPSSDNPRHLFDPVPLADLKDSIRHNGVLVPITVFHLKGQDKYAILDGERRYICCKELEEEGQPVMIPANVVEPPDKLAGILYMFSIHNFRQDWELMPTALSLRTVMTDTDEHDTRRLCQLTGLGGAQVERCKKLLTFPERFQKLSLDPNPETRIPPNLWIEAYPVLDVCEKELPDLVADLGRDGITDVFVQKYRSRRIKSVIHFRRIMEAYEEERTQAEAIGRLRDFILDEGLETRKAFDGLVEERRKIEGAVDACDTFIRQIQRLKLDYTVERDEIIRALKEVREYADQLLQNLAGSDPPPIETSEEIDE